MATGQFSHSDTLTARALAAWNGSAWHEEGGGLNGNGNALCEDNGHLIVGGYYDYAGGVPLKFIASWDGAYWSRLGSPAGHGLDYLSIVTFPFQGKLVFGGDLHLAGAAQASNVAAWDGSTWSAFGAGFNGAPAPWATSAVIALTSWNDRLVAGGIFLQSGDTPARYVASWDGSSWEQLGDAPDSSVYSLTVWQSSLVAGGTFDRAGGAPCANIALYDGTWHPLGIGCNGKVDALAVYNGNLIAAGEFQLAGGVPVNYIARWNGSQWAPLGSGLNGEVVSLCLYNGSLIAGGFFTSSGTVPVHGVAAWDGSQWRPLGLGMSGGMATSVWSLASSNNILVAGGDFAHAGGYAASNIAAWDGTAWAPLGSGTDGKVYGTAYWNGDFYAGGLFNYAGGLPSFFAGRWVTDATSVPETPASTGFIRGPLRFANPFAPGGEILVDPRALLGNGGAGLHRSRDLQIVLFDPAGRLVTTLWRGGNAGEPLRLRWDGRTAAGRAVPAGVYYLFAGTGGLRASAPVVLLR